MFDYIINAVCEGIVRLILVVLVVGIAIGLISGGIIYLFIK